MWQSLRGAPNSRGDSSGHGRTSASDRPANPWATEERRWSTHAGPASGSAEPPSLRVRFAVLRSLNARPRLVRPGALKMRTNCLINGMGKWVERSVGRIAPATESDPFRHQNGGPWALLSGSTANERASAKGRGAFRTEEMISGSRPLGIRPDLVWRLNIVVPASIACGPAMGPQPHWSLRALHVHPGRRERPLAAAGFLERSLPRAMRGSCRFTSAGGRFGPTGGGA